MSDYRKREELDDRWEKLKDPTHKYNDIDPIGIENRDAAIHVNVNRQDYDPEHMGTYVKDVPLAGDFVQGSMNIAVSGEFLSDTINKRHAGPGMSEQEKEIARQNALDAAASAAENWALKKLEDIKKTLWATEKVPLLGICEDIAILSSKKEDLSGDLLKGLSKFTSRLLGVSTDQNAYDDSKLGGGAPYVNMLYNLVKEFLDSMSSDPDLQKAMGSLSWVQESVKVIQDIMDVIGFVNEIWENFVEPMIPWIQIACEMSSLRTLQEAGNDVSEQMNLLQRDLFVLGTDSVKDLLSNVEIELPSIAVGAFDDFFGDSISRGWGDGKASEYAQAFFNDDADSIKNKYAQNFKNNNSWYGKVDGALEDPTGALNSYIEGLQGSATGAGKAWWDALDDVYFNSFTNSFLTGVYSNAQNHIYMPNKWDHVIVVTIDNSSEEDTLDPPEGGGGRSRRFGTRSKEDDDAGKDQDIQGLSAISAGNK